MMELVDELPSIDLWGVISRLSVVLLAEHVPPPGDDYPGASGGLARTVARKAEGILQASWLWVKKKTLGDIWGPQVLVYFSFYQYNQLIGFYF